MFSSFDEIYKPFISPKNIKIFKTYCTYAKETFFELGQTGKFGYI